MIYNYECAVLRFINSIIPEIREAVYSADEDFFNSLDRAKKFPCFYYNRTSTVWTWDKPIYNVDVKNNKGVQNYLYPFEQSYEGHILVSNQATAFKLVNELKFKWHNNPSVDVLVPSLQSYIKVALRLTGIQVTDVRLPSDTLGAARLISFTWQSNLCLAYSPQSEGADPLVLVEGVRIYLDNNNNTVYETLSDSSIPASERLASVEGSIIYSKIP